MKTIRELAHFRPKTHLSLLSLPIIYSLASFSACGRPLEDAEQSSAESSFSPSASTSQILNFKKVENGLYRSGEPTSADFYRLRSIGVKTIISLQDYGGSYYIKNQEANRARALGMKFVWIPMSPSAKPTLIQINRALAAIEAAKGAPMLVHCNKGVDRTGIVVAAYRMTKNGWTAARAKSELRQNGHYTQLYWWDSVLDQLTPASVPQPAIATGNTSTQSPAEIAPITPAIAPPAAAIQAAVVGDMALTSNPNVQIGMPKMRGQPEILISRSQYVLSWNKSRRVLNWAAWELNRSHFGSSGRQDNFALDSDLNNHLSANGGGRAVGPSEFSSSCLDRGHQVPSADRTANETDNGATFLMSNMIPQAAYTNRVVWEHLEGHERRIARNSNGSKVYVIAGSIFPSAPKNIGPRNDIAVPSKSFKIILRVGSTGKPTVVAAAIIPNLTSTGTDPLTDRSQACEDSSSIDLAASSQVPDNVWMQYQVPVTQIEQEAGIDLSYVK